jgi:predicted nucleic acid-binding protein
MVVADSGPLIIFARTCGIGLLRSVVSDILVPRDVALECTSQRDKPGARAIQLAIDRGHLIVEDNVDLSSLPQVLPLLGPGELAAIALAKTRRVPVLMDEKIGREVARQQGVQIVGSLGALLKAKQSGAINEIRPILEVWLNVGYRISAALMAEVLRLAGE